MKILEEDQEAENDGRPRDGDADRDRPPTVTPGREGKGRKEVRKGRKEGEASPR